MSDKILDELGIALQTKNNHTQWVSLRQLINVLIEAIKDKISEEDDNTRIEKWGENGV